ncbi:hypothetical protein ZHAS_00014651 [Anopheles sinensis]|uniref:Uncharacterized protein n=1 Tax=Anopheles sinensis TaxID=74873 RepID=A0A084W8R6_ANOSI|nr:hypothetical protein ZHAS_00014651 [Anopheles sinensis]
MPDLEVWHPDWRFISFASDTVGDILSLLMTSGHRWHSPPDLNFHHSKVVLLVARSAGGPSVATAPQLPVRLRHSGH